MIRSFLLTTIAMFLTFGVLGCSSPGTDAETQTKENKANSDLSPRDQYVADFAVLVNGIVETVEPVHDAATASHALEQLKKLDSVANELGATMKKLNQAVEKDSDADDQLIGYLQNELKEKYGAKLSSLQSKFGKTKAESKYPQLGETVGKLIDTAMND